jgi:arginine utilization regulatory protein
LNKNVTGISPQVQQFFAHYDWPGNVRELEHIIEGAMNLVGKDKLIEKSHLPQHFLRSVSAADLAHKGLSSSPGTSATPLTEATIVQYSREVSNNQQSLQKLKEIHHEAEKTIIKRALAMSKGNVAQAVKVLGLSSPQALQYKMKKLKLDRTEFLNKMA